MKKNFETQKEYHMKNDINDVFLGGGKIEIPYITKSEIMKLYIVTF